MSPESIAERARAAPEPVRPPGFFGSVLRGMVGFTLVSLAGFAPWAVLGGLFKGRANGELEMYVSCAVVFLVLSGVALHKLIIGPGSLWRFYVIFTPAFVLYAAAWTVAYMVLRGHVGSVVGLLGGTVLMAAVLCWSFGQWAAVAKIAAVLFVANAAGYFGGGVLEAELAKTNMTVAMLSWGLCYGLGFGAGLGLSFYMLQGRARALMAV